MVKLHTGFPLMASLDITYRCNLKCKMCNVWKIKKKERELNSREWKSIVDQLIDAFSIQFLRLVGGEPFLHPNLTDIINHIKARGCKLTVVSNGTLINREMAECIISEHVDCVRISINGLQKIDDFYRGKGTFAKTMKGLQALMQEKKLQSADKPRIEIHPFVSKANCEEILKLLLLSRQLETDFNYHYLRVAENARGKDPGFPDATTKSSVMSLQEKKAFERRISILQSLRERFLHTLFSKLTKLPWRECTRTAYHLLIDPWGYIFPCEKLYDYPYGNCKEKTVKEIWLSHRRIVLRQQIKNGSLRICQDCDSRRFLPPIPFTSLLSLHALSEWSILRRIIHIST